MNKRQKIVQQQFLGNEEAVIKRLTQVYNQSLKDVTAKSEKLYKEIEELTSVYDDIEDEAEKAVLKSRIQSKVYQKQYQDSLKKQVSDVLDNMHENSYTTVADYLKKCYEDGFVGSLYDIQGQGIPLAFPLDQEAMVRAVQLDSKISTGLYTHLGEDVAMLKKHITAQVSRGIASSMTFAQIAQQLSTKMVGQYKNPGGSLYNAMRIARTEGHRIQCQAGMDACYKAKDRGADVVKQWDSTLDAKTRDSHVRVDGEIRELDEKFSNGLMFPGDPSGGAAEVIHCRCALLQRARWAVKGGFTKMNNFTKQLETFDSPESYEEFKKGFFSKENKRYMNYVQAMEGKYKTKDWNKLLDAMTDREAEHYLKLCENNPMFNKKALTNNVKSDKIQAVKIEDCKTAEEVQEYFKSKKWFNVQEINGKTYDTNDNIDLKGCDVVCAKEIFKAHQQVFEKYPQLIGKLNSINATVLDGFTYAQCSVGFGHGGISVNVQKFKDSAKLASSYASDLKSGYHPAGTDWTSIVTHELGHAIDDYLTNTVHVAGFQKGGWLPKYVSADMRPKAMKACGLKVSDAYKEVSGYATKNSKEWFAECFAEYMKSDKPRKVATEFGKRLDEIMKGVQ